MGLQNQALHSIKWSFLSEIASSCVIPIVFIVNRKLLKPEDFAIVVAATIFISFAQIIWGAGLSKALIQKQDKIKESANVVFWVNSFLGISLFILFYFAAPWIAITFKDERIKDVLRLLSLLLVFSSFSSVHTALFQKELQFKKIFWIRIMTVALPGLCSIPLAYLYHSYWALVIGSLVGQFFQSLLLWLMSTWKPELSFDRKVFRELWKFGGWVLISTLSAWFYIWADSLIVGIYNVDNPKEFGVYQSGNQFSTLVFGIFLTPIVPVLYSALSKISHDKEKLKIKHQLVIKIFAMISLPIGFGLYILQNQIEVVVFNTNWQGISMVIGVLGLAQSLSWVIVPNVEVYRAIGRPEIETKVMGGTLLIYLVAYLIAIPFGITIFIWTRFSMTCLGVIAHFYFAKVILDFPLKKWFTLTISSLISAFLMLIVLKFINSQISVGVGSLAILVLIGITIYGLSIVLFEHKFIKAEILSLIPKK